ncbi:amino acid adenylation domain-containing protein (plasmid) [Rhizobium leguminosarum]
MQTSISSPCGNGARPFVFVHEWVRRRAELHPDRNAVIDEKGDGISYSELMQRCDRLARRIAARGVRADDCVAAFTNRPVTSLVAMLATLNAGSAYMALDPTHPREHLAAVLDNLRPALVITDRDVGDLVDAQIPIITTQDVETDGDGPLAAVLEPDNLAYVVYTSGSTGVPKGVPMSHRGLTRLIRWQVGDGPPGLATLQFTSLGFDVIFQEVFSTLCSSGCLVLISDQVRKDPEALLLTLRDRGIERLFLPYVALQQLAQAAQRSNLVPKTLRHVITAGERLITTDAIVDFFRVLPHCRLDNHYGPSEAHLVTSHTLTSDPAGWPPLPPIGRPVGGVALYNLDAELKPVAPGEVGELYVGGVGTARGYVNAPAATAERFLPDLFRSKAGERAYRTGDLARVDAEGQFHFIGRSDDQIKVRGFRVEPAEVELALTSHSDVSEAAVVHRRIADCMDGLVAYVVCNGAPVAAPELLRHVRAILPAHMVPVQICCVDALPLTRSGKADRRALTQLPLPPLLSNARAEGSLTDGVLAIWERILGHDEFSADDDFFEVGGDSLLATWAVAEISQFLGREIPLSLLLRNSTVAGLLEALHAQAAEPALRPSHSELVTLRPGPSARPLFLLHPLGGELVAYRELVRSIRYPLRILGLQWRPHDRAEAHCASVEEMAAAHIAQIRNVQPNGPYLLAGWSFGGVLAFEMARQIVALGEHVDFLGLLDANPVRDPITGRPTAQSPHLDLLNCVLEEVEHEPSGGSTSINVSNLFADPTWRDLLGGSIPNGVPASHLRKNIRIARDSMRAAMDYQPKPYLGAIDLFQADASSAAIQGRLAEDLRGLAQGAFRIHAVPGDHCGIMRAPHVASMAQALEVALGCLGQELVP